jgi:hypothetical protein
VGISLKCPECGAKLKVPDRVSGRSIVCPLCAARLEVQETGGVYQLAPDDQLPAEAPRRANRDQPTGTPSVVKVIVKTVSPPVKEEPSWIAKHVTELLVGVVGTVATAALLAIFGLSKGDNKGEAKDEKAAVRPVGKTLVAAEKQEPGKPPATTDRRVCWVNVSYNSTIVQRDGKVWVEIENATGKEKWQLIEQNRTAAYIELKGGSPGLIRHYDSRAEYLAGTNWAWVANGSWKAKA